MVRLSFVIQPILRPRPFRTNCFRSAFTPLPLYPPQPSCNRYGSFRTAFTVPRRPSAAPHICSRTVMTSDIPSTNNAGIDTIVASTRFQAAFLDQSTDDTVSVHLVPASKWSAYVESQPAQQQTWLSSFPSPPQSPIPIPSPDNTVSRFVVSVKANPNPIWRLAAAFAQLPSAKSYSIDRSLPEVSAQIVELAWGLVSYSFTMYKKSDTKPSHLVRLTPPNSDARTAVDRALTATYMVRDMISVPAEDFGPPQLEAAVSTLAAQQSASSSSIVADQLLTLGYPQVHRVGRAASPHRSPRLLELLWGQESAPIVTLVGKGVCYDTGGLSLKPTSSMLTMKKDMAGAAQILALAFMVMDARLPVRLRVLVPAVENTLAAESYRPGDVLTARNGMTTLNGNSDAEGRLVLADALVAATEQKPDIIIDCATLTGAQRVAMGPEIPSFFCTDDEVSTQLFEAGKQVNDLMWPMPLYEPYRKMLDTPLADIKSCSSGSQGGCITAALYLKEFVGESLWIHVDMMGYNSTSSAGRPEGGEAMGLRALFELLRQRYPCKE